MLHKTMVVLAIAVVLGGSALSSSAFARDGGYAGGSSLGRGDFRGNQAAGTVRDGRTTGDGRSSHGGRVRGLRDRWRGDRGGDVWGHWGEYYGPMVSVP